MKKFNLFLLCLSITVLSFAQTIPQQYYDLIKKADSLYNTKDYKSSALTYSQAFKANDLKGFSNDRYNAACSWALANYPDSAFYNLNRIATLMNYAEYGHITSDTDLKVLHNDKRWKPLLEVVKLNKDKAEANLNKPLVKELDSIYVEDQKYRLELDDLEKKFGENSEEIQTQYRLIVKKDSVNLKKVVAIIDRYGWLGTDVIGVQGNATIFLVIQHADIAIQEKYIPMMRDAVKKGKAFGSDLALLEDRVAFRQGKRQIYGSQIGRDNETHNYFILPLEDPDNVDKRRAEVGLSTIAEYVNHWQIKWDVEQYKKDLPALESKVKLINK